jgi:photosystem II stability/assembly factor-like uncharacterized protein
MAGLLGSAAACWWWLDPVAPLFIAYVAVREGQELGAEMHVGVTDPQSGQRKQVARRLAPFAAIGLALIASLVVAALVSVGGTSGDGGPDDSVLPKTSDYHSLLVLADDPGHILLGTHRGLYESRDGGRSWDWDALPGRDAMNLAPSDERTVWAAGHQVFAKSSDGGGSWTDVRPSGLPSLDIHGFTTDPRNKATLWAAIAAEGLYRSDDGGKSFELVSDDVGGNVLALAVTDAGSLLVGDTKKGLLLSADGGREWRAVIPSPVLGLAVNPAESTVIIAGGPGILRSSDGGETWEEVHAVSSGVGPVAWSPTHPQIGYAVGLDRRLYETHDQGRSWHSVDKPPRQRRR